MPPFRWMIMCSLLTLSACAGAASGGGSSYTATASEDADSYKLYQGLMQY